MDSELGGLDFIYSAVCTAAVCTEAAAAVHTAAAVCAAAPPPKTPRVLLELLPIYILILVKLPKSIAFPVDEIVMKSIVSEYVGSI